MGGFKGEKKNLNRAKTIVALVLGMGSKNGFLEELRFRLLKKVRESAKQRGEEEAGGEGHSRQNGPRGQTMQAWWPWEL